MRRPIIHGLVLAIITLCVGLATIGGVRLSGDRHVFAAPVTGLSLPGVAANVPSTDENVVRPPAINRTLRVMPAVPAKQLEVADQLAALSVTPTVEPPQIAQAQEGAAARAASSAPPPDLPLYQVYQVQEGDNVGTIASRFHVDSEYIVANNAEIQNSDVLKLGESIIVPAGNGILHEVRYGETLTDIAARYDVNTNVITAFVPNHIAAPDDITERQVVFVPNAKTPVAAATATATPDTPTATSSPSDSAAATDAPSDTSDPPATDTPADSGSSAGGSIVGGGPRSGHGLIWPVVGPISSYYGPSHPLGIDIDGYNLAETQLGCAKGAFSVRQQSHKSPENHDRSAEPHPEHERIHEGMDFITFSAVCHTGEHHVEIFLRRAVQFHLCSGLLVPGLVEPFFRGHRAN